MLELDYLFLIVQQPAKAVDSLLIYEFLRGIDVDIGIMRIFTGTLRTKPNFCSFQGEEYDIS
jgi:hypothetical protein